MRKSADAKMYSMHSTENQRKQLPSAGALVDAKGELK
jgi:hypothetical protein